MCNIIKFDLELVVPQAIEIFHTNNKIRLRGNKEDIRQLAREFYKLKELKDGQLCKLGNYILKVSDYLTEDREKERWIELPALAWGVMGSKFMEVTYEEEDNPFDFNDCSYTDRNPFDLGIEVMDLPIRYMEFYDDGTYEQKIVHR